MKTVLAVIFTLLFLVWGITRVVASIQFEQGCGGYLKRTADANTVDLAKQNLAVAIQYAEDHNLTSGYTSVLYTTPDEDLGFWYKNLTASMKELEEVRPEATQLERTNVLMKLRETLLDQGEHVSVTVPQGISIYPSNGFYLFWAWASVLLALGFWIAATWDWGCWWGYD